MIGLLGNEDLIANVKRNIKNNTTPHCQLINDCDGPVSYTHLRAHET